MKRYSTTVKLTREIVSLIHTYARVTRQGVMLRYNRKDFGYSGNITGLNVISGKVLSRITIKKETLANMVEDLRRIGYTTDDGRSITDGIVASESGFCSFEDMLHSMNKHDYVPTISGNGWKHFVIMLAVYNSGGTYYREGCFFGKYTERFEGLNLRV